jgi:2,3-bisphosphoglycerate-independent phosphoglycerate mutase
MVSPIVLCILDGFGLNPREDGNAVVQANTPVLDRLLRECPRSTLVTCGERVGLPSGQMGNSEVGHLNIGAGRVIEQWLLRISNALRGNFLQESKSYGNFIHNIRDSRALHLIGLYSDGGVHSHRGHLHLLLDRVTQDFSGNIYLHIITDGRDVAPESAFAQLAELEVFVERYPTVSIKTLCGRFYAMDRDRRWERVRKAYDVIVSGKGAAASSPCEYVKASYTAQITDEFLEPARFGEYEGVSPGDAALFWNFREDRMREIGKALVVPEFEGFPRDRVPFERERTLGFTEYDHSFHIPYLFDQLLIENHLGEALSKAGVRQLRVAETEKYAHVTYFFNGGIEKEYIGEDRHLVPSPRDVKTYDEKPEMSARAVTDAVVDGMNSGKYRFIVVNFANCDMVGHTGSLPAAIKAVETVDECVGRLVDTASKSGWQLLILADHGNAEQMIHYEDGTPHTAHTTFPVPVILFGNPEKRTLRDGGALCDIAPTVLELLQIPQPKEMTGKSLLS